MSDSQLTLLDDQGGNGATVLGVKVLRSALWPGKRLGVRPGDPWPELTERLQSRARDVWIGPLPSKIVVNALQTPTSGQKGGEVFENGKDVSAKWWM
jgi:hypothetical protein